MKKFLLVVLLLCIAAVPALANSLVGPLITIVNTDKARYLTTETPQIYITLSNHTGAAWNGSVDVAYMGQGYAGTAVTVHPPASMPTCTLGGSPPVWTCPGGAVVTLTATPVLPAATDQRGYMVVVNAWNTGHTAYTDQAVGAVEVASDWGKFGRECFVTKFQTGIGVVATTQDLNARHCNVEQYYGAAWKNHVPAPPTGGSAIPGCVDCWYGLEGNLIDPVTLNGLLSNAGSMRMTRLLYILWNGAYGPNNLTAPSSSNPGDYQADGSGASFNWGEFHNGYNALYYPVITELVDQRQQGVWCGGGSTQSSDPTSGGGILSAPLPFAPPLGPAAWQTCWLALMNPGNTAWQTYIAGKLNAMYSVYAFDGTQLDTIGEPPNPGGTYGQGWSYDAAGTPYKEDWYLATFTNNLVTSTTKAAVFNAVSQWDVAQVGTSATYINYSEVWPYPIDYAGTQAGSQAFVFMSYEDLNTGVERWRQANTKSINIAGYLNQVRSQTCQPWVQLTACTINEPTLRMADATILASGGWHVHETDYNQLATAVDITNSPSLLYSSANTQSALLDYNNFAVGHENLLRDGVARGLEGASYTSGAVATDPFGNPLPVCTGLCSISPPFVTSNTFAAGQVETLSESKAGYQILHLLNYTNLQSAAAVYGASYTGASSDWSDSSGTHPAPQTFTGIGMKMYYIGVVPTGAKLFVTSPDYQHGVDISVAYTKGSDAGGTYVLFTVPYLRYWTMAYLELDSKFGFDYGTNGLASVLRGGWANETTPGIGVQSAFLVNNSVAGSYGQYNKVAFSAPSTQVHMTYAATAASNVEVWMDNPVTGTKVCTIPLGNTGSLTTPGLTSVACAISGTHNLFFKFTTATPAAIWSFNFS